jgi:hypothetical protein
VPDEEVRRTICSADVCLAPDPKSSYTDRSTLIKVAEYMALSRATVSYDLTESRVTAGDAAAFAGNNDPIEFAARIDELLDDPERRRRLGAAGRARVERGLAWEHSEPALLAAYRRVLTKRPSMTGHTSWPAGLASMIEGVGQGCDGACRKIGRGPTTTARGSALGDRSAARRSHRRAVSGG